MILFAGRDVYSKKWLKSKLQSHFGSHLIFTGKQNVLWFKDMTDCILNKEWYDDKKSNVEEEAERIITTAAKLIRQEIGKMELSTELYPSSKDIEKTTTKNSFQ